MWCGVSRYTVEWWCVLAEGKMWAGERPSKDNVVISLSPYLTPTFENHNNNNIDRTNINNEIVGNCMA